VTKTSVFRNFRFISDDRCRTAKAYITIAIRLRYDYDEKLTCSFLLASNRVKWKHARAIRRSRI